MSTIFERLKEERERLDLSQTAFAAIGKSGKNSQINYETGKRAPGSEYLRLLSEAGVDVLYILTGRREVPVASSGALAMTSLLLHGTMPQPGALDQFRPKPSAETPPQPTYSVALNGEDFAAILRRNVQLSAGSGAENADPALIATLAFRREWLNRLGVNPSDAVIVSVRGDSMEPGLHDGDLALIDQARKALRTGRIYALTDIDGATRVKRIEILQGQGFLLRSDNLAYPVEARLNDDSNRINIIGQVVWSGHTHKE